MHTILLVNKFPSMLGCSSLLPSETAFLMHSLFQLQKSTCCHGDGWLMQLRSFFFFIWSQLRLLRLPFWTTITILFVGCNKDSENFFFFSKKRTELEVRYTLLCACSITGASLQFCFSFFFSHHSWRNPWSPSACCTTLTPPVLFPAAEVTRVFFLPPYFPLTLFSS